MNISSGDLRQVVTFSNNTDQEALGAGFEDGYNDILTTRGLLRKNDGSRDMNFGNFTFDSGWTLFTRYQPGITTLLTTTTRIAVGSDADSQDTRYFFIKSYELIDQKKKFYKFILNETEYKKNNLTPP